MLRNQDLAELLSREAKTHSDHRRRALERAARAALWRWPVEAAGLHTSNRSLTELELVGPWIATIIGLAFHGLVVMVERRLVIQ